MNTATIDTALRNPKEIAITKDGKLLSQEEIRRLTVADLASHDVVIKGQPLSLGVIYPSGNLAGFGWRGVANGVSNIRSDTPAVDLFVEVYNLINNCYVNGNWII